jgi:hypothetical protein
MGIFGWSYPPGAAGDPNAPYNQTDEPCAMCGKWSDDCICPECPECGEHGNPKCYVNSESDTRHGLLPSREQIVSLAEAAAQWAADNAAIDEAYLGGAEEKWP